MHEIYLIDPLTKSISDVHLQRNVQKELYEEFPYPDGQAVGFGDGNEKAENILTTNPYGQVDGTGLKDGYFWIKHPNLGWDCYFGKGFFFGSFPDELLTNYSKDDMPIQTPKMSKEELMGIISWEPPEGCTIPSMANIPYEDVKVMAQRWAILELGAGYKLAKMLSGGM